ncbi:MAG: pyridoxamine 5'-phosphate oxidase family protein [Thermoplasmata archaeon]|nr:pyridoxamine 5'-phosphate oxidase family protein [Thermoplasmata archaeon]
MKFTERSEIKRYKERASYNFEDLKYLLEKVQFCNLSFCSDNQAFIVPLNFAMMDDKIYVHASKESRLARQLSDGKNVTLSFVFVEKVVTDNKLCNYSMDYSSAVVFGKANTVKDDKEKLNFFIELGKKLDPLNYKNVILPEKNDLDQVAVISIDIEEFSLKSRIGFRNI